MAKRLKTKIDLGNGVRGILVISIDIPRAAQDALELQGIGKDEQDNLTGQYLQEVAALLGVEPA